MEAPELVETPEDLSAALEELAHAKVLTVDTEFFWERTYDPLLCLVQVAARDPQGKLTGFAIDPLAVDIDPLLRFLAEPTRLKVFHAARIDLEILNRMLGATLAPVYDTQRAAALLGFKLRVSTPRGYEVDTQLAALDGTPASKGWQNFADPVEACAGADLVTTDVWTSMGYEAENEARKKAFANWCVDAEMMAAARPDALFMHCLPAHRGEEVTAEVIDGPQSVVWDEAENRMHAQKALLEYLLLGRQG